jgi:hypothetical protein
VNTVGGKRERHTLSVSVENKRWWSQHLSLYRWLLLCRLLRFTHKCCFNNWISRQCVMADIKSPHTNFGGTDMASANHFLLCPHTHSRLFTKPTNIANEIYCTQQASFQRQAPLCNDHPTTLMCTAKKYPWDLHMKLK